jgi:lipopolysaccharide transport system ATP-binding protein
MSVVIRAEHLSKRYRLGVIDRRMLYEELQGWWARVRGREDPNAPIFRQHARVENGMCWALQDASFDIHQGEVVGIIGGNGAGKSTLLKILSEITPPSSGRALLQGRVASLLEVGTGFHPELTGRDNVYLNGAIMGLTRRDVRARFDDIAAFSGVEDYLDTPVKRYSSGMRVRLGFAVAAHLEPEILIIDEVLAVGDAAFQQKCLGKLGEVARTGRTVLFVSHNLSSVENLCQRGIVLKSGQLVFDGTQTEAIAHYLDSIGESGVSLRDRKDRTGSGELRVSAIEMRDSEGRSTRTVFAGQDVELHVHFENPQRLQFSGLSVQIMVKTQLESPVFTHSNRLSRCQFENLPAAGRFVCRIPRLPLPVSTFRLSFLIAAMTGSATLAVDAMENAFEFDVAGGDFFGIGKLPKIAQGVCLVPAEWHIQSDSTANVAASEVAV